eukprot:3757744-Rhodomonas_salina.1
MEKDGVRCKDRLQRQDCEIGQVYTLAVEIKQTWQPPSGLFGQKNPNERKKEYEGTTSSNRKSPHKARWLFRRRMMEVETASWQRLHVLGEKQTHVEPPRCITEKSQILQCIRQLLLRLTQCVVGVAIQRRCCLRLVCGLVGRLGGIGGLPFDGLEARRRRPSFDPDLAARCLECRRADAQQCSHLRQRNPVELAQHALGDHEGLSSVFAV